MSAVYTIDGAICVVAVCAAAGLTRLVPQMEILSTTFIVAALLKAAERIASCVITRKLPNKRRQNQ